MLQYTSEEALNGILNILDTVVKEHAEAKSKSSDYSHVGDLVTELLGGVAAGASSNVNIGSQVEELAKGMTLLKDSGVTDADAKTVASVIDTIGASIKQLEFSEVNVNSVYSIALALALFGSIDESIINNINRLGEIDYELVYQISDFVDMFGAIQIDSMKTVIETMNSIKTDTTKAFDIFSIVAAIGSINELTIENINNLSKLDFSVADNLREFVEKLDFTKIGAMNEKRVNANIAYLSKLLDSINNVIYKKTSTMSLLLGPIKGWFIGKSIANFLKLIVKTALGDKDKINILIKGLGELLDAFSKYTEKDSKYSIKKLLKVFNKQNGLLIGSFFSAIIGEIPQPDPKTHKMPKLDGITELIKVISEFGLWKYIKLSLILTESNGAKIGKFFYGILKDLPGDNNTHKRIYAIKELIETLGKISLLHILSIKLLGTVLTEKLGSNISKFIHKLVDSFSLEEVKKIQEFNKGIKTLSESIVILTGSVLLMTAGIAIFGIVKIIEGIVAITAFTGGVFMIFKQVMKHNKDIHDATKTFLSMALAISLITLNVIALTLVAKQVRKMKWESLGKIAVMYAMLGVLATVMIAVGNKWKEGGINAAISIVGLCASLLIASVAIGIVVDIAQKHKMKDILLGVGVLLFTMLSLVMLTKLLSKVDKSDMLWGVLALGLMVVIMAGVALVTGMLIGIGPLGDKAAVGAVVVLGIILALEGMVYLLKAVSTKDILWGVGILTCLAFMLLGVSLITKELLIPIGKDYPDALIGAGIVVGLIVVFGGIVATVSYLIHKHPNAVDDIKTGILVIGAIVLLMFVAAKATQEFLKCALMIKGLTFGEVAGAMGVMAALFIGFGALTAIISSQIHDHPNVEKDIATGVIIVAAIAALIYGASKAILEFLKCAQMIHGIKGEDIAIASGVMASLLAAFGVIILGTGALVDTGIGAEIIAAGVIVIGGIIALIVAATAATEYFCDVAVRIAKYKEKDIELGGKIMAKVFGAFGLVVAAIGAIMTGTLGLGAIAFGLGESAIRSMAGLMHLIIPAVDEFIAELMRVRIANGNSEKWEGGTLQKTGILLINVIGDISKAIEAFKDLEDSLFTWDIDKSLETSKLLVEIIDSYMNVVIKASENIKPEDITAFDKVIIGKGMNDKTAMIGCLIASISAFKELEKKIWLFDIDTSIETAHLIIKVISEFMEVVARVATLQYIIGYDLNGKPIYEVLDPEDFGRAASVVTTKFFEFVSKMKTGFDGINIFTTALIKEIADAMEPLIECVAKFVDVVLKVTSGLVLSGYDSNGKALYVNLDSTMFSEAASTIVESFTSFITTLRDEVVNKMNDDIIDLIEDLGEALMPMMTAISGYVDAVMKMATGTYTITLNGKSETLSVTPEMFGSAATKINSLFLDFIGLLKTKITDMDEDTAEVIEDLGKGLGVMMEGISSYVDAIMKMATGTYLIGYDSNKNGIYMHVSDPQLNSAAGVIVNKFKDFLTNMITYINLNNIDEDAASVVKALGEGTGPVMKSVKDFADAILKLATGSYQTGTDRNGNPTYKKLTYAEIRDAATQLTTYYTLFLLKMLELASDPKFLGAGIETMKLLGKSVQPIISSAVDFANMIVTFLSPHGTIKNAKGKDVPFRLNLNQINGAAKKIATAYMTFVNTLYTQISLNKSLLNNIKKISKYMKDISSVVSMSAEGAKQFSEMVSTILKIKGLDAAAKNTKDSVIVKFTNAISYLADDIMKSSANFTLAKEAYQQILQMITFAANVSKPFATLMNTLDGIKSLPKYQKLCSDFGGALNVLTNISGVVPDFSLMPGYITKVLNVAVQLQKLEAIMNNSKMTEACLNFIKDIEILTLQGLTRRVAASRRALGLFGVDLSKFALKVIFTDKHVIIFTTNMNKASKSLTTFDNLLINKEKMRNEAIKHMAELIERTADAVSKLQKNIESLDQNKILANFKNISEMLELAKSSGEEAAHPNNNTVNNNRLDNITNNGRVPIPTGATVPQTIPAQTPANMRGKTMCTFQFSNISFTGFMETKKM